MKLSLLFVLGLFLIVPFQNCAQTSPSVSPTGLTSSAAVSAANASGGSAGGQPVTVIDPVNATTGLIFSATEASGPASAQAISLTGVCSAQQNGATLRWVLLDHATGQQLASETMECDQASFRVDINPALLPECGVAYPVEAHLGMGSAGHGTVTKLCGI